MTLPIIIVNWKMNFNYQQAQDYFYVLQEHKINIPEKLIFAVPNIYLCPLSYKFQQYAFAAQDITAIQEDYGPYTGEVSSKMLESLLVTSAIVGHSERRQLFYEDDETAFIKAQNCIKYNINPIICIGETHEIRLKNLQVEYIKQQISKLQPLFKNEFKQITIAYEPRWAIGSNSTPTISEITDIVKVIAESIFIEFPGIENKVNIVYGGSVSLFNTSDILSIDEINGILIGGAALNPHNLVKIIQKIKEL